jgi:hypothetical protein
MSKITNDEITITIPFKPGLKNETECEKREIERAKIIQQINSVQSIFRTIQMLDIGGDFWLDEVQELCRLGEGINAGVGDQFEKFTMNH